MAYRKPQRYRSRPVDVTAIQYDGSDESVTAIRTWTNKNPTGQAWFCLYNAVVQQCELYVAKSDAWCRVNRGDWVVQERDNSGWYPVSEADFKARYVIPGTKSAKTPQTDGPEGK